MSTKGTILLAVGMLILGLVLGLGTAAFAGQMGRVAPLARIGLQNVLPRAQQSVNGARVSQVEANSPASKAGLQNGDVVTAVSGTKVDPTNTLADLIQAKKPGDKVDLTVTRGTQTLTISVELGASPNNSSAAYLGVRFAPPGPAGFRRQLRPRGELPTG
ncbi:MAG: PDZ domain-containing protein [Chloroflexi bacterium]|nr:PDZ domain-containing protein [Chloroflexota bacterium]